MARPGPLAALPPHRGLVRYLLDGEQIVVAAHQHWAKVAEPVASAAAGLVLALAVDSFLPASLGFVANVFWWAWFGLVGRAIWKVLERRHDWLVATDKRLILTYGLITRKVAMMPLTKVTDMSYNRSPLGRLLGYGTFVMESAGQDQALHTVGWVADPDHTYRAMCAEIFGIDNAERGPDPDQHDERFTGGPPSHTARDRCIPQHSRPATADGPPNGPDTTDYSTAIPIRTPGSHPISSGADEPDIHDADTGPISY
jgi:membrane protein YdbS with pleckstrin-like domain